MFRNGNNENLSVSMLMVLIKISKAVKRYPTFLKIKWTKIELIITLKMAFYILWPSQSSKTIIKIAEGKRSKTR